jgi:hypothetical protein
MESWSDQLPELQADVHGPVFTIGTPGYEDEVAVFNMAVQHRPRFAVGATTAADIRAAVAFASRYDLNVAVLNTGHGPSIAADTDTLMVTTKRMRRITIDAENSSARIEAGVRFGELAEAAAPYGLAPLAGSSPGVGVVGYTLSGGASSTMGRKYGWASDHVSAMDVVTSDGQIRRTSALCESDLFGALLGGRSNFGIVTAMEFALFPVTKLYAGALFYAGEHILQVLDGYRKFTESAPDELTTGFALLNFPALPGLPLFMQGKLIVSVRVSYVGDSDTGASLIASLRQVAPVLADTVTDIPYPQFGSITNDPIDPAPAVEHFGLLRELNRDTVDAIVRVVGPESGSTINIVDIRHLQGAFSRPASLWNAVGARDAAFAVFGMTFVPPGQEVSDYRQSGSELLATLGPWLHDKTNPCFMGPSDATANGTKRAYDPNVYDRLQTVKTQYDPGNRFRLNHNIPPHTGG